MAQQTINIGAFADDGTGDPLRTAFDKTNDNFDEAYAHIADTSGNPHSVTLEEARAVANALSGNVDFNGNDIVDLVSLGFNGGEAITWNGTDYTFDAPTGLGPVNQIGQEIFTIVYNDTGAQIDNGKAVYPTGAFNGFPTIAKAISSTHENVDEKVLLTTMDIANASYGVVVDLVGKVRGVDTNAWSLGDTLYVSAATAGDLTNVKPEFPNYPIQIGGVNVKDASNGEIQAAISGTPENTIINYWNGCFREKFDFLVTSNGSVITGTLTPTNGHPDMTMMFSDGFEMLDTDPGATVTLTAGTDTTPQTNYVYILQSNKVLAVSTSEWPDTVEHIKVAECFLQTAATTQTNGSLRNQNYNDEVQDTDNNQGHMSHVGARIRKINAAWDSGALATLSGTTANVYIGTTSGKIYQMHLQTFPAQDMSGGDDIHVVNDFSTPYRTTTNLNDATEYSTGSSNQNDWFSLVIWGVCNKTGETSHLMCNLSSDGYNSEASAQDDALNFSDYTIPASFEGVGFLIARFVVRRSSTTWTYNGGSSYIDLRGSIPNNTAGGGSGGGGVTEFTGLTDTPASYSGQALKVARVNAGETALEFGDAGAVDSVFGRTGAVVAVADDYEASEVTNAFDKTADDADDVDDSGSTNKFTTAAEITKLAGISTSADVAGDVLPDFGLIVGDASLTGSSQGQMILWAPSSGTETCTLSQSSLPPTGTRWWIYVLPSSTGIWRMVAAGTPQVNGVTYADTDVIMSLDANSPTWLSIVHYGSGLYGITTAGIQPTSAELSAGTDEGFRQFSIADIKSMIDTHAATADNTKTLTNKTIDGDDNTLQDIATSSLKTRTGADGSVVTGTAGTANYPITWNGDGDAVDGPVNLLFGAALSDETTALTTGNKFTTDVPNACVITRVYASVVTQPTGAAIQIDVEDEGTTILNAVLSISVSTNNAETSTFTGATSSYSFSKGDLLSVDIEQIGSSVAGAGAKIYFYGYLV